MKLFQNEYKKADAEKFNKFVGRSRAVRVQGSGIPCVKCGTISELRKREVFLDKDFDKEFIYSKWFRCNNKDCITKIFYCEEFKVYPKDFKAFKEKLEQKLEV